MAAVAAIEARDGVGGGGSSILLVVMEVVAMAQ